jgi:hypothetical protein
MNTKLSITLTENDEHKPSRIQTEVEPVPTTNRWSTAIQSWVDEFQQHRQGESLPAFDSSLTDALS